MLFSYHNPWLLVIGMEALQLVGVRLLLLQKVVLREVSGNRITSQLPAQAGQTNFHDGP